MARKESALSRFADLDAEMDSSQRHIEDVERLIISCRRERDSLIGRQAQISQRKEQMEAARSRLAQVEAQLGEARTELGDYSYLAKVFGPDEIQLFEIQAAGPEVSSLVNALLEDCFDNKFEIRFRTHRPKADGRGLIDDFDIEVRNKNLDRTCLVDELLGGQFVLVNEAVNLGITIYNMRRGESIRYETLFRDETVGDQRQRICAHAAPRYGSRRVPSSDLHLPHATRLGAGRSHTFGRWRECGHWESREAS